MGPMGELGALFNPGMRHEQEERRAKALRREEEGDSREVDPRIDLESGVAVITTDDQESGPHRSTTGASQPSDDSPSTGRLPAAEPAAEVPPAPARPRPRGKRGLADRTR